MDIDTMIDALNWMDIEDQIGYLQMLDHDYPECSTEDLEVIIETLAEIQTLGQADELTGLFGDRICLTFSKKISIKIAK